MPVKVYIYIITYISFTIYVFNSLFCGYKLFRAILYVQKRKLI